MFQHFPSRALRARVVLAILSALALLGALFAAPAPAGASPTPTATLSVSASTDPVLLAALNGAPGASIPTVLTAVNVQFEATVSLSSAQNKDTTVALSPRSGVGRLSTTQVVIPANTTSVTVDEKYDTATSALQIHAEAIDSNKIASGNSAAFRVESSLSVLAGGSSPLTAGADGAGCTTVGPANPICGIVDLPNGTTTNAVMTIGPCNAGTPHCHTGNTVTQFIAGMTGLYTRADPARMTLVCDKSLCGKGGVPHYTAQWAQSATDPLTAAPACPSKGVIGADQDFCTDYVSSSRDNAGDLLLVVLFAKDVRGTI